tara:strand:+ start:1445 stop:2332 length:888 start_codon:yes stop_codon:yes gene_type:complete
MQLVHIIPKILLKHKLINLLCSLGLQDRVTNIQFNEISNIFIDLLDQEPRNVFIKKIFEPDFFEVANCFLPNDGTFFDVGANVGFCTFGLLPKKPNITYHIFEANHELIYLIKKSIDLCSVSSCFVVNACVAEKSGETQFYLSKVQTGQSHVAVGKEKGIQVTNVVLDEYCQEKSIKNIDFVKVDLEGNEIPALKGFQKSLSSQNISALYIEVIPENQERYNFSTFELLSYLESLGYSLFLCKSNDFGSFGNLPVQKKFKHGTLMVSKFLAKDYPLSFATDVLVVSKKYLNNLPS